MPAVVAGFSRRRHRLALAIERQRRDAVRLKIVLIPLDLLLLAIHEVDVVAEEQVHVLVPAARQLLLDRLELEQQIVAECADQRQARILGIPELLDQRAQDRKRRGLLAALLFGEELRQRQQASHQRTALLPERLPMRMLRQDRIQHLRQHLPAQIERPKLDLAIDRDDLERRPCGGDVPARVSPRKLISGGKINAAMCVQILQKTLQSFLEADLGDSAGDGDTAASGIPEFTHVSLQLSAISGRQKRRHSWL